MNVTYPKFKMGEEVVREVAEPATYSMYIDCYLFQYSVIRLENMHILLHNLILRLKRITQKGCKNTSLRQGFTQMLLSYLGNT